MAILGLLTIEPMSGYDMKQFCERSLAHFWRESYGNLYPRLKRLAADGLIRGRRKPRARGPDSTLYSITPRGRARLRAWLRDPPEPEHTRSEFLLKIFFGAEAGAALSEARIREHEREQKRTLDAYEAIERAIREEISERPETPYLLMSLRRGQMLTEARLRWCRECRALLKEMKKREEN